MGKIKCDLLLKYFIILKDWLYDIFIITRKNLRIRRRRYVAFMLEMFAPIMIVSFLVRSNYSKALLRVGTFELTSADEIRAKIDTLEGFYDLGGHFDMETILNHTLCRQQDDPTNCRIGFIADPATRSAIFDSQHLKSVFNATKFVDEDEVHSCFENPADCLKIDGKDDTSDAPDAIVGFRGLVVFETSVNDVEVKYKIRLMEKNYNSLRHVLKTNRLYPSIYDRREYGKSYLESGFLSLQIYIDRMIILHMKSQSNTPEAASIDFSKNSKCTCEVSMHETPHRQSDQFHDHEDPLDLSPDYEFHDHDNHDHEGDDAGFLHNGLEDVDRADKVHKQSLIVSTILVLSFTFVIPSEQRRISSEKEIGLTILLLVTGMTHRMQWLGNLLAITLSYMFPITVVTILLTARFNEREGAVFEYVSGSVLWLLLFLYVMALASLCYVTTVFFDKPMTSIAASVCFWVPSFLAPLYHIDYYYDLVPIWVIILAGLHPSIAVQTGLRILIRFEKHEVPTDMFTLTRTIPTDPVKFIYIVFILTFDIILFMMLAIYLDRVLKSKFGVSKHWYYIFKLSEYQSSSGKVAPAEMIKRSMSIQQPGYEPCSEHAKASIITNDLTKKYGSTVALENVNVEFNHGEIFALLGHNGSGKSTLLNLFSGFTPTTSGTATICGYDIRSHMVQIQEFTGICPQTSSLYEDLTPKEHLLIFGRLRGLRGIDATEQSMELMEKLRFQEMANWTTRKLSKGDKRKLSLAIALIGNPKVVLLDEPTGGLDYYSRRAVWDLLLKIRSNHTIIFSTHYMDEAELLGDRIGILSSGKMEVCGSHPFLRRYYGLGYSLRIRMDPETNPDSQEILEVVRGVMPNATLSNLRFSPNGNRLCICNLPLQDYSSTAMSSLFIVLARLKESLGIEGFSVSTASVDEIFLTLSKQVNPRAGETPLIDLENENYNDDMHDELLKKFKRAGQSKSIFRPLIHFHLLFIKRMLQAWRSRKILIFQIVLPFTIFIIAIIRISSHVDLHGRSAPPLEFNLDHYENAMTLYHSSNSSFIKPSLLRAVIGRSAISARSSDLSGDYIRLEYNVLRSRHVVGISAETGDKSEIYVHFTPYAIHSAPLALNLYANTLVKYMDINRKITTINHPLMNPYFEGANFEEDPYAPDLYAMLSTLAATTNVAFCILFPLEERLTKVKHLQFMAGVRPCIYWLAIFCWDTLMIILQTLLVVLFTFFYEPLRVFSQNRDIDKTGDGILLIMGSFVYSGLMLAYAITHFAHSKSGGFALYMSTTILMGIILPFFILGVGVNHDHEVNHFVWFFRLFPPFALTSALRKFSLTLLGNGRCNHFTELGLRRYCKSESLHHTEQWSQAYRVSCCPNCLDFHGVKNCYDTKELVRTPWSAAYHKHDDHHDKVITENLNERSIFPEVLSLVLTGVAFNIVTIFLDSDSWAYLYSCVCGERSRAFQTDVDDEDVVAEMDKTSDLINAKKMNTEALVVHNLCKSYGTYPALHNLSFIVRPGECFGIIGVNGAGKSTLFRLLTGQSTQSYGNAYSVDCSLATKRAKFMQKIGFTTEQTSLLWPYMTCRENLVLLGRLRGLNRREANDVTKELLKLMRLEKLDKSVLEDLSGGIRRRLTALLAVVAEPPILIFDEPTSSADPNTQRDYWELIKGMRKAGHTILLNSHRIHECEELCHRVVILIDGKFQCIGSPRHLREKFGSGFKLLVKLIPGPAESQGYVSSLSDTIVKTFNPCTLRDRRRNVIQYVIHNADFAWDFLFQMMEHIKLRYNDLVEDYSFSNTTMEEVFLSFVILQNCGRLLDQLV